MEVDEEDEEDEEEPMILDEDRPQQQDRQVLAMPCPQAQWVPCGQAGAGAGLGGPAQGHGAPGGPLDSGGTSTTPSLPCNGFGPCKSCPSAWGPAPSSVLVAESCSASVCQPGGTGNSSLEWPHAASFSSRTDGDAGCGNHSFAGMFYRSFFDSFL